MGLFKRRYKASHVGSIEEFERLLSDGKPVFVNFYQSGCAPCQVMDGIINEVAEEFQEGVIVVKANVATVPELFYKFKVRSTPTFVVLTPVNGGMHPRWRQSGLVKKDVIVGHLTRAVSSAG